MKKILTIALLSMGLLNSALASMPFPSSLVGSWSEANQTKDADVITFDSYERVTMEKKVYIDEAKNLYCKYSWLGMVHVAYVDPKTGEISTMFLDFNNPQLVHPGPDVSIADCMKQHVGNCEEYANYANGVLKVQYIQGWNLFKKN